MGLGYWGVTGGIGIGWFDWYGYWFVLEPSTEREARPQRDAVGGAAAGGRCWKRRERLCERQSARRGLGASGGEAGRRGNALPGNFPARSYTRLRRGPGGNSPGIAFAGALTREGRCAAARPTRPAPWGAVAQRGRQVNPGERSEHHGGRRPCERASRATPDLSPPKQAGRTQEGARSAACVRLAVGGFGGIG